MRAKVERKVREKWQEGITDKHLSCIIFYR